MRKSYDLKKRTQIELSTSRDFNTDDKTMATTTATESSSPAVVSSNQNLSTPWRSYVVVLVLLIVNLLNYMDRFTVSAVLLDIQAYYKIKNSNAGLLQTVFICSYMILSPIFGYMGDRYSRKAIMIVGILFWSLVTLAGSFIGSDYFPVFLLLRGCVGVGEASYSTIAPTIISDLFCGDQRSNMLALFYFAIPVGSGLGYIVGSNVAAALGNWKWALRVTPGLGVLSAIAILLLIRDPKRGEAEGTQHMEATSWTKDITCLVKNKTFILSTFGFTCVAAVAGALGFWAPAFMTNSVRVQGRTPNEANIALIFGVVTCAAGFCGVAIGSQSARYLRRTNQRSDPLVCAAGLLLCAPFLFLSLVFSEFNTALTWTLIFFGELMLCLNWSIVADIVLYVVIPTRRSTAEAFQILVSHLLGDAGAPYLIGVISDAITAANPQKSKLITEFASLQYALYSLTFVSVIGGGFFLASALYVIDDKQKALDESKAPQTNSTEATPSDTTRELNNTAHLARELNTTNSAIENEISYDNPTFTT